MSVLDWVDVNAMATGVAPWSWFAGKFSSTTGDTINGYVGSRAAHIIGPDYKIVCDLEDLLTQIPVVGNLLEALGPILGGLGGNVSFTYGANSSLTYFGPVASVRRAPKWEKTADSILGKAEFKGPGGHHNKADVTDTAVNVGVLALSTLMIGTAAGLHIAARVEYGKMASAEAKVEKAKENQAETEKDHPDDHEKQKEAEEKTEEAEQEAEETEEKAEKKLELYALLLKVIMPRLMSFIKLLEEACTIGEFAKKFAQIFWPILLPLSLASYLLLLVTFPVTFVVTFPGLVAETMDQDEFVESFSWQVDAITSAVKFSVESLKEAAAGE